MNGQRLKACTCQHLHSCRERALWSLPRQPQAALVPRLTPGERRELNGELLAIARAAQATKTEHIAVTPSARNSSGVTGKPYGPKFISTTLTAKSNAFKYSKIN